jgi:hypothetical protein
VTGGIDPYLDVDAGMTGTKAGLSLLIRLNGSSNARLGRPGVIQHPYLPRPPQTRAASFKRLYPK